MNKLYCIIIGLCVLCSCQDSLDEIIVNEKNSVLTRSITPTTSPVFEWWDTTSLALPGLSIPVTLPWYNGASTQIPSYMLTDYKPEDGWEMVYNYCISTPPGRRK